MSREVSSEPEPEYGRCFCKSLRIICSENNSQLKNCSPQREIDRGWLAVDGVGYVSAEVVGRVLQKGLSKLVGEEQLSVLMSTMALNTLVTYLTITGASIPRMITASTATENSFQPKIK